MLHIVTLSGNSKRFTDKGFPHKALCQVDGKSVISHFVECFYNFETYPSIFLCRNEDLLTTNLEHEIKNVAKNSTVIGIETNNLGPVFSISRIFDNIPDNMPVLITYIDSIQKIDLNELTERFRGCDGGITLHDFSNPHWRTNKSFCLVSHPKGKNVASIVEKFDFANFDFSSSNCGGSSGSYYFRNGKILKSMFSRLMNNGVRVNNEYYVTQALGEMVSLGMRVECEYYPYVCLGIPEDVQDYRYWIDWFKIK